MQSLRSALEPSQTTTQGKLPRQPYVRRTDITNILFSKSRTRGINAPGPVFYFRKIFRFGVTIWRCEDMYIVEASLDANQKRIEVSPMGCAKAA